MSDEEFPYPSDEPGDIARVRGAFQRFATDLNTTSGNVKSDASVVNTSGGWNGGGAVAAQTELSGNAALIDKAATAMSDVDAAFQPYATAVDQARSDIDGLRQQYQRGVDDHNTRMQQIRDNTMVAPKLRSMNEQDEISRWNGVADGLHNTYTGIINTVSTAARKTRSTLEGIATNIGGNKVPANASQHDIELAMEQGLPLYHQQVADQDAAAAADLLPKAAGGDPRAIAALQQYKNEAGDPYFATALMNRLGPKELLDIPGIMAQHSKGVYHSDNMGSYRITVQNNAGMLNFLSTALASASSTTIPGQGVTQDWMRQLKEQGRADHETADKKYYSGYWALGQIMRAAGPKPPYGTSFLNDVGNDMIDWQRDRMNSGIPRAAVDTGGGPYMGADQCADSPGIYLDGNNPDTFGNDPLIGLMNAASTNRDGAQDIFMHKSAGQKEDNLTYLLHDYRGSWGDKGNELGHALQTATVGTDPRSLQLTAETVHVLGQDNKGLISVDDNGNAKFGQGADAFSGMRDSVSSMLSAHIHDINTSLANTDHSGDAVLGNTISFDPKDLGYLLMDTERDTNAFNTLLGAQLTYTKNDLDFAASHSGATNLSSIAGTDSGTLGYLLQAHRAGISADARAQDAQSGLLADYVKKGLGLVPLPGIGSVGKLGYDQATTWITGQLKTHAVVQAYANADNYDLQAQAAVDQMIQSTYISHNLWPAGHQPPTGTFEVPGGTEPADFVDPSGHVIPPERWTPNQQAHFNDWVKYNDATIPQAKIDAGTNFDHWQEQYRRLLGLDS